MEEEPKPKKKAAFVGAILGRRRSGKTSLLIDMLLTFYRKRFAMIIFMSRTIALQDDVWARLGGKGIMLVPNIDNELIKNVNEYMESHLDKEVLLVFDDCGLEMRRNANLQGKNSGDDAISDIAFSGRHKMISCVYLAQTYTMLSTQYRGQLDWFIVLTLSTRDQQLVYYEALSDMFRRDFQAFERFHYEHTGNFQFYIVINEGGKFRAYETSQKLSPYQEEEKL